MRKRGILLISCVMMMLMSYADNWMSRLPDDTYVAVVTIPGAHDAATGCGWAEGIEMLGDSYARTQDIDLAGLWQVGIRAFDFRPCVYEDYMNLNHGIMPTKMHFEDALCLLRDSLKANPSEFAIIHLLHEQDGDIVQNEYTQRLLEVFRRDDLKDLLLDFKTDLRVSDVRGKILILSRDRYATMPVGGFLTNWTGEINVEKQTAGIIVGKKTEDNGKLYMQDFSDTHGTDGINKKVGAIRQMLLRSTRNKTTSKGSIRWVFNFASGYSKTENIFGNEVSTSDGYRDNATNTHEAFLTFFENNTPGPAGIVLMDFAGVDDSNGYHVRGKELTDALIAFNFRYLDDATALHLISANDTRVRHSSAQWFSLEGRQIGVPKQKGIFLMRQENGLLRKMVVR